MIKMTIQKTVKQREIITNLFPFGGFFSMVNTKSLTEVEEREFRADAVLDNAADSIAAMTKPAAQGGMCCAAKYGKISSVLVISDGSAPKNVKSMIPRNRKNANWQKTNKPLHTIADWALRNDLHDKRRCTRS